ncbi:MAG: ABC transporter ATP-binding protein [Verrucomicrobia bacterium]|nr:ABC transporter ATP-binding protein [Verrucomicrobiota bacterium]
MPSEPLLHVENLSITFSSHGRTTQAVKSICFSVGTGEVLAVVGESGSGKSVSALSLTRLLPSPPLCNIQGSILWRGRDLQKITEEQLTQIRGKEIAYIFQDPGTSLNPVYTIGYQIAEAVKIHEPTTKDIDAVVHQSLHDVLIDDPHKVAQQYPHELSGGMQQRAMIAMALACNPKLLVADEPTTALDVTIQKEIIDLLKRLRQQRKMSILLITHNFGIVAHFADRVQVMRQGEIVESGETTTVMQNPAHPYTRGLIACIPRLGQRRRRLTTLSEEIKP